MNWSSRTFYGRAAVCSFCWIFNEHQLSETVSLWLFSECEDSPEISKTVGSIEQDACCGTSP